MGKTEYGFIYACYGKNSEPLVLGTTNAEDMLRFATVRDGLLELKKIFNGKAKMPPSCYGEIALRAIQLKENKGKPSYFSDNLRMAIEPL